MKNDLFFTKQGDGEAIVFIHGFTLAHRMWQPQVEKLSKTNTVITYDMRGFGESPVPDGKYSHHEDLRKLLDKLNVGKCLLVGLSLGGEVAIDFTITLDIINLEDTETVNGILTKTSNQYSNQTDSNSFSL